MNRNHLLAIMAVPFIVAGCREESSSRSPLPDSVEATQGALSDSATYTTSGASGEPISHAPEESLKKTGTPEPEEPSTPEYLFTPSEARRQVREHYEQECEQNPNKPRLPYHDTFEKAMKGDPDALRTVFFNKDYHSGDNESWAFTGWPLAHLAGDARFAAFLKRLAPKERAYVFEEIFYEGSDIPDAITNGYFARTLPRVAAIYQADHPDEQVRGLGKR